MRHRKAKIRCRCRDCGARNTKSGTLKHGLARARCRACGAVGRLRVDQWAERRGWLEGRRCACVGVPFPHRPRLHGYIVHRKGDLLVWCHQTTEAQASAFQARAEQPASFDLFSEEPTHV